MAQFTTFSSSSRLSAAALTECWKLDAGQATTLQPRQAGVFRVTQGAVWATVNGMQHGEPELPGDRLLKVGDSLALQAGQRLVVESWDAAAKAPVYFRWEPVVEVVWDGRHEASSAGAQWRGGVVQPSRDLVHALRSAGAAASRLVLGLVGLGDYLVVGRGRAL
nr:DUF2917 domain-containing protein [uncultured Albidiferax sp.]